MRDLDAAEIGVVERAKSAVADLVKLADPRGPIAGRETRSRVHWSAKYLLADIARLEAELTQEAIVDLFRRVT